MLFLYFYKYKSIVTLTSILFLSYSSLFWQSNVLSRSLFSFSEVLDFFNLTFHNISRDISWVFDSYKDYDSLKKENKLLKKKIEETTSIHLELDNLRATDKQLRELLELTTEHDLNNLKTIKAEIISHKPDNWFRRMIINKGRKHGIKPYMPVVAYSIQGDVVDYAVVGKTIQVSTNTTKILSITDQYFKLGILLEKTGHWGLLEGQRPYSENLLVKYLPISVDIQPGDSIITSGGNGIFMPYMQVGRVKEKKLSSIGYQIVIVEPLIDISKLKFVEIVLKEVDSELIELQQKEITVSDTSND